MVHAGFSHWRIQELAEILEAFLGMVQSGFGGLAQAVIPHCRHNIIIDEDLLLKGLQIIYEKNR